MSYDIPRGNDLQLALQTAGYAAPRGNDAQFLVPAPVPGVSQDDHGFDQKWNVIFYPYDNHQRDDLWMVAIPSHDDARNNARWLVLLPPHGDAEATQAWLVEIPPHGDNDAEQLWSVLLPEYDDQELNEMWHSIIFNWGSVTFIYGSEIWSDVELIDTFATNKQWSKVDIGNPLLNRQWGSITLPSDMGQAWSSIDFPSPLCTPRWSSAAMRSDLLAVAWSAVDIKSELKTTNTKYAALKVVYPLIDATVTVSTVPATLTIRGQVLSLLRAEVSEDEGQFAWTCQVTLLDPSFYSMFSRDDEFSVTIGGETYEFIVDSMQLSRSSVVDATATISGIGPSAVMADPRALKFTKTWDEVVFARDVAEELLTTVDWRTLDWPIAAFRLAASGTAPISIVQRVAGAIGGVLEADPDGSLYVRYKFPVSVPSFSSETIDQEYSDMDDNFSVSSTPTNELTNKLRILDVALDAFADQIEFVPDPLDPTKGVLKVWPSPWRESFTVEDTSLPIVSVERVGVVEETLEETIEILHGEGSTSKPIYAINTLEWLFVDLGGLVFESDKNKVTSTDPDKKESLVTINYQTRYVLYNAVAFIDAKVQFLVVEPDYA